MNPSKTEKKTASDDGADRVVQTAPASAASAPTPPTSPAPTIGTEKPVAVERREGAGPVPAGQVGRIKNPLGKRGRRQREAQAA